MFELIRVFQMPTRWSANGECSGRIPRAASALKALNLWGKRDVQREEKRQIYNVARRAMSA
jgi:hypothetical protein